MSYRPFPDADRARRQVARHSRSLNPQRSTVVIMKHPTVPEGWSQAAAARVGTPIQALKESMLRVKPTATALTIGRPSVASITIADPSSAQSVEIRTEWTQEETAHYGQTGETPLARLHRQNLAAMWGNGASGSR